MIRLIVADDLFAVGMKEISLISAFIDMLKQPNEIARWGAFFGPFLLGQGQYVCRPRRQCKNKGSAITYSMFEAILRARTSRQMIFQQKKLWLS